MPIILIIDDQPNRIRYFIQGLEGAGYVVDVRQDVANALAYLEAPPADLVAILVDIIMPPGPFANLEHMGGTRTGIFLYSKICEIKALQGISQYPVPLAVLSQTNDNATLAALNQVQMEKRPREKGHHQVWSKVGLEVDDFVREFKDFLATVKELYSK